MPGKLRVDLENKIDVAIDAMKMAIEQEDYAEFFEIYGDIYCELDKELRLALRQKEERYKDVILDLIFNYLIPDSVDTMKESWSV